MESENEKKLKEIVKQIETYIENSPKYVFDGEKLPFRVSLIRENDTVIEMEKPGCARKRDYLLFILRLIKLKGSISSQQYRSEKGKVRKQQYHEVLLFLKKRGFESIEKDFEDFCNKEIPVAKVSIQFSCPVKREEITICTLD